MGYLLSKFTHSFYVPAGYMAPLCPPNSLAYPKDLTRQFLRQLSQAAKLACWRKNRISLNEDTAWEYLHSPLHRPLGLVFKTSDVGLVACFPLFSRTLEPPLRLWWPLLPAGPGIWLQAPCLGPLASLSCCHALPPQKANNGPGH